MDQTIEQKDKNKKKNGLLHLRDSKIKNFKFVSNISYIATNKTTQWTIDR